MTRSDLNKVEAWLLAGISKEMREDFLDIKPKTRKLLLAAAPARAGHYPGRRC